jgi:hypothetical protein
MSDPKIIVRKSKNRKPTPQRIVAKFLVDRLLNNMDMVKQFEDALAGEGDPNAMEHLFDDDFPELEGYPCDLLEEDLLAFIEKHGIPENYGNLDFSERSERFHS